MSGTERASDHGAFVPGVRCSAAATGHGPLDGLKFAVKDLIDVAGVVTGAGNPDWRDRHAPAAGTAACVTTLLNAGAALDGKTVTDELAFSLEGENHHYGTPVNPRCPDRLPGGSSSGSAVAVAAGLVDFALGTDTGGSVRVPASFCGIWGMRPTHGRIPLDGVMPFAPGYDTIGWLSGSAGLLRRVGAVLLGAASGQAPAQLTARVPLRASARLLIAADAFALADGEAGVALRAAAVRLGAENEVDVYGGAGPEWLECYRVLQGAEIWASLGGWIRAARPRFGPPIMERFADAAAVDDAGVRRYAPLRRAIRDRMQALLPPGTALLVPSAPGAALRKGSSGAERGEFYRRALTLCCIAGHAGLPQVSFPAAELHGAPLGLSLIAAAGADEWLLELAALRAPTA